MLSIAKLTFTISVLCNFSNTKIPREKKEICAEHFTNCAIQGSGETSQELLDKCRKEWIDRK